MTTLRNFKDHRRIWIGRLLPVAAATRTVCDGKRRRQAVGDAHLRSAPDIGSNGNIDTRAHAEGCSALPELRLPARAPAPCSSSGSPGSRLQAPGSRLQAPGPRPRLQLHRRARACGYISQRCRVLARRLVSSVGVSQDTERKSRGFDSQPGLRQCTQAHTLRRVVRVLLISFRKSPLLMV